MYRLQHSKGRILIKPHQKKMSSFSPQWHWFPHQLRCLSVHCQSVDHRGHQIRGGSRDRKQTHLVKQGTHCWSHSRSFSGVCGILTFPRSMGMSKAKRRQSLGSSAEPLRGQDPRHTHSGPPWPVCIYSLGHQSVTPSPFPPVPLKALLKMLNTNQMEVHLYIFYSSNATLEKWMNLGLC